MERKGVDDPKGRLSLERNRKRRQPGLGFFAFEPSLGMGESVALAVGF